MLLPLTPVRFLDRAADLYGKKTGVICGDRRFTYGEFAARCGRLSSALKSGGIRPGDRVAYLSFNTHRLLEGYYGVVQARAIVMPLNVRLTPSELIAILNHAEARILFFETDFASLVEQLRRECPSIERFVALDAAVKQADALYEDLLSAGEPERANFLDYDEHAIAELFYTSGSTGTPKGVTLSHRTLYLHGLSVAGSVSGGDTEVELHTIPLFHANGWGRPQACTLNGLTQVMVRRFEPSTVFRLIQDEGATTMSLVPTMGNALLNAPDLKAYDFSSLQVIHVGGAAASPELIERLSIAFDCDVRAGYGLTETSPVVTSARRKGTVHYKNDREKYTRQSMAGWPIPGVEVRVVDPLMKDVPRDMESIGEVVIRGDHVMEGYYRDPEGTAAVMTGEWFHTGDMAVWDEETYLHIVDRKKDIIISGGENISSIEVEKAISAHPSVFECAVVAAPDEKWGEIPVALVTLKPGHILTTEEMRTFLEDRLAKFKQPRAFEFTYEPLPKTGTGKIVKRAIRDRFWTGRTRMVQG